MASVYEIVGSNIATLRREAGLTQERLAALAKIGRPFLTRMEGGFAKPSVQTLVAIAIALDVEVALLFRLPSVEENAGGSTQRALARLATRLPEIDARLVLAFTRRLLRKPFAVPGSSPSARLDAAVPAVVPAAAEAVGGGAPVRGARKRR